MTTRTISVMVCVAVMAAGCGSESPTVPTTDFIAIDSITPASGTTLTAGERVTFTARVTYTLVSAEGGFTAMVLQDHRNQSLLDIDERSPEAAIRKGTATVTLSHAITIPATATTVNALFPLFVDGVTSTRAVVVRSYPVR